MAHKSKNQDGFTLLEVLVAFVVLSGVLGIVFQLLSQGTLQSTSSEKETQAILIAKSKMAAPIIDIGRTEGTDDQYHWITETRRITAEEDGDFPAKMVNVKVSVQWQEFRGDREVNFETIKLIRERR